MVSEQILELNKYPQNIYNYFICNKNASYHFYFIIALIIFLMAEQQIQELKSKLEAQQQQFENYKLECKQLEQFLESESQKKQEQIRKLKQQSIKKQKNYGLLKTQVGQLQSENATLKAQLNQLKAQQSNAQPVVDKSPEYLKQIQQLKSKVQSLNTQCNNYKSKIQTLQTKSSQEPKSAKGKTQGDNKKLQEAFAASKSKIADLQRQNQKLKQQLREASKKSPGKQVREQKRQAKDNKQQQRHLHEKISKLQKKLSQSEAQTSKAQQNNMKLSKQVKQLKNKLMSSEMQKQGLSKKVQKMMSSSIRREQKVMKERNDDDQNQIIEQQKQISYTSSPNMFSALFLTKKHYVSPFLEIKNDNSIKILKSTKNGSFEKSLGSIKYKLNDISYNSDQVIENCARIAKEDLTNGIKSSIILFGPKKTTKKYLLANLITKLKDFLLQKVSQSQQELQAFFIKASPDPQKKVQILGHNKQQLQQILNKIVQMATKSPKKPQNGKVKVQPKPKARYFKLVQGELYIQIITTSFTNFPLRETLSASQAFNSIAYSRLPNALQPTDCRRQVIIILNPIVSLYDECKNALSITNCKKSVESTQSNEYDLKTSQIKQDYLNDAVKKRMENFQRQIEQQTLKARRQQQDINFYKGKFQQLQLRLKGLLNTHRQQNNYLKKSPVTLSYEKMLKFVHSVQTKNPSIHKSSSIEIQGSRLHQIAYDTGDGENEYQNDEGEGEDIL